jgi:hypothetical protein
MSAGSTLEPRPFAVAGNGASLRRRAAANGRPGGAAVTPISPPRAVAPTGTVAELCTEFAEVCESAVDPLEIASALEFEGIGDRTARGRYGVYDVFALANDMYARVPRRPAPPPPEEDPWQMGRLRPLLHGLLYALPAVCFPAAGALLIGPGVLVALVVALLVAWGLSQGLAAVGYLRLGTTDPDQARHVLRAGMLVCLAGVVAAMTLTGIAVHAHSLVLFFGAGEGVYMLGACVLMVLGAEKWLPAALAPGVAGSAVFLILGKPAGLEHLIWAALAATPLLSCAAALYYGRPAKPRTGPLLVGAELLAAVPAVCFGLVAAGLLTYPVVAGPDGHGGVNPGALLASLPLSVSIGVAEWSLLWYRRRTQRLLRATGDPRAFGWQARLALLTALAQYVAAAAALTALAVAIANATGLVHFSWQDAPDLAAYLMLGSAMFLVLLMQAMRIRFLPLAATAAALAAELVFRSGGMAVQVVVPAALLLVVAVNAAVSLGRAVRHGY